MYVPEDIMHVPEDIPEDIFPRRHPRRHGPGLIVSRLALLSVQFVDATTSLRCIGRVVRLQDLQQLLGFYADRHL
jgi:hypothetical protein